MAHTRAHIRLNNQVDAIGLVQALCNHSDEFSIENFSGDRRINAKSINGVMYATLDFNDEMFLVNDAGGAIPSSIDIYRVIAS